MNHDVALRGAVIGLAAALGGLITGIIAMQGDHGGGTWTLIWIALGAAGILGGYLALYASAKAVRSVVLASQRVADGDLAQRVSEAPAPVAELSRAFNTMSGRVQELFDSIAAEEARLEAVFDASTDAMVALSRDTTVRFLNPAAVGIFQTTMTRAIGRPFIETARDYELDGLVRRAIGSGAGEMAVITFGANRVSLRVLAAPIRDGGDWAVLLVLTDLTEVQRIDQVRRDFVSNVSHELRTPLASIRALAETLEEGVEDPADQREFLARLGQQVERLTALVNELLDLSRIESGAIDLHPEPVDLAEIVDEAASLLKTRLEQAEVQIERPEGEHAVVEGDRASILRAVNNLLDNAIKYSPRGGVIHTATADEGDLVALIVRDEGPGIPEHDLGRVFERFYKGEASRSTSGTGLGLAIVKHLVRAHGGTATAESHPAGATFTIRLPKRFVGRRPAEMGR